MRRKDREVTDFQTMVDIMSRCQVCRLAMNDGEMPYIVPVNFGMEVRDGAVILYFHGAKAGRKYDLLRAAPKVSFEMDCETVLCSDRTAGNCTMAYESVIGWGDTAFLEGEEKVHALDVLTAHYHPEGFDYDKTIIPATAVCQLTVRSMTGKIRPRA